MSNTMHDHGETIATAKNIKWSQVIEPDKDCMYTHIYGDTPVGRCVISWKEWKDHHDFELEDSFLGSSKLYASLAKAKMAAQQMFESLVNDCLKEQP